MSAAAAGAGAPPGAKAPTGAEVRVWDPFVRIGHWTLASAVAIAWLAHEGPVVLHESAGYLALAVVALRLVWGFVGPARARFSDFVRGPAATLAYARAVFACREPRVLGHNPLGAWMILALLATVAVTGVSGWLLDTDAFFGSEPVETVHALAANLLLGLIPLHVLGVILASRRHGENLVLAMLTGRKRAG
ncbi:MAG: cytochrome b/b6 domain-containing protein [Geminicoccaceae bacterium]|nr:cytochrome b/b6 domain-containing protein [Geminicoccaceae bacterium]